MAQRQPVYHTPYAHEGDILFLRRWDEFLPRDYDALVRPAPGCQKGRIPKRATGHPVIVLRRQSKQSTHVLVTTVSSYGSGPGNGFAPPWERGCNRRKDKADFRAFDGAERPCDEYPPLRLRDGRQFPKSRTCWVYVQSALVVPFSVLGWFKLSPEPLRMERSSLMDLRRHMAKRCLVWEDRLRELNAAEQTSPSCLSQPRWRPSNSETPSPPCRRLPSSPWTRPADANQQERQRASAATGSTRARPNPEESVREASGAVSGDRTQEGTCYPTGWCASWGGREW
ncbi:hypothetical protein C8A03DRAFT_37278 [Achaetomium macrosporum]|uniref:Uncharacterized protein n=1 Tax=Achaetomium macrosporum TaxID=79813 RepID=A0AAN7C3V6_9PEZI|nr:hypothetical protein C8A03DRAFT_37278 [Achaetomium macrosporum]